MARRHHVGWRSASFPVVLAALIALVVSALVGLTQESAQAAKAPAAPCNIYKSGGTPCVAAHSTTRALFRAYAGPLYQVKRWSDGTTTDIKPLKAGDYANAATQDAFCAGTSCTITKIYDQTKNHNDLTIEGPGGNGGQNAGANAAALPVTAGGHKVYGVYVSAGVGYRDNDTDNVATGHEAEGMYMVTEGSHYNDRCCFDYGNAETSSLDTGNGHMDALNYGTECWFHCNTPGPRVQADLENGLFQGGDGEYADNVGRASPFVTALLKNNGTTKYAIKDGDSQSGPLATRYSGPLPGTGGYRPMHLEGAIVLGTGGDNSNGSVGSYFEGVMTKGYPSDATEEAVQANIVSVGYTKTTTFPVANQSYQITNVHNGNSLAAASCNPDNGANVDVEAATGSDCQQWQFTPADNGTWTIANAHGGKVMDAYYCGQGDGTNVDLYASLGNKCQQWAVIPAGGDRYELVVENSGMVLDADSCLSKGDADTNAQLYQWLDNECQEWSITPTP